MPALIAASAESWSNFVANVAQVGAILVGGWWTYTRFIRQRANFPRATLQQVIAHRKLDEARTYVRVALQIQNTGSVLLPNKQARTDLYQVLPLTPESKKALGDETLIPHGQHEAAWPCLGSYDVPTEGKIEPGNDDQFAFDFFIPGDVESVYVYSYVENPTAKNLGWSLGSLYDLDTADRRQTQRVDNAPVGAER